MRVFARVTVPPLACITLWMSDRVEAKHDKHARCAQAAHNVIEDLQRLPSLVSSTGGTDFEARSIDQRCCKRQAYGIYLIVLQETDVLGYVVLV